MALALASAGLQHFADNAQSSQHLDSTDTSTTHSEQNSRSFSDNSFAIPDAVPEAWFGTEICLTHDAFDTISTNLRSLGRPPNWSNNPKIYYIFQRMRQPELFRKFLGSGYTDSWLPFSERTLRRLLEQTEITSFLALQNLCLDGQPSDSLKGRHFSLNSAEDLGLDEVDILGSGGFGEVHSVKDRRTGFTYAMKTMSRPGVYKQHVSLMSSFERELHGLRRVNHIHCVEHIASATDLHSVMLLCSPVADMDLAKFLESDLDSAGQEILRNGFGCITSALEYLHSLNIRYVVYAIKTTKTHVGQTQRLKTRQCLGVQAATLVN
jgi:hypothetical protein